MTGHGFSPDGQSFGITPVVARLLQTAGFPEVQQAVHMVNYSAGTPAWTEFFHNMELASHLGARMAAQVELPTIAETPQDPAQLIRQALIEMQQEDFCGIWWFLSSWAVKPQE